MKQILLLLFTFCCILQTQAQNNAVGSLPPGRYEAFVKQDQNKWVKGDIVLLDGSRYKISTTEEVGEYRFSATAQRVIFTSGPLKSVFAKTVIREGEPAIVLPLSENSQQGFNLASSDVVATLKKVAIKEPVNSLRKINS